MVNLINLLEIQAWNTGVWGNLIYWFYSFIGSYGWTIILFTVALKIVLLPLDYFQRKVTKRNSEIQAIMEPELDKVRAKYANNQEILQQKLNEKQMEVYKSQNYNIFGSCIIMLANLVITMVVFFSLFSSLNNIAKIQISNQYENYKIAYEAVIADGGTSEQAEAKVLELYEQGEYNESWLWVKNVWKGDTNTNPVANYSEYIKLSGKTEEEVTEADYNKVMGVLVEKEANTWNGYFILIILSGVISYASSVITTHVSKKKDQTEKKKANDDPTAKAQASSGMVMKIVLPVTMVIFTWMSNAIFAMYVCANSLFAIVTTPLINLITSGSKKRKENKEIKILSANKAEYDRNNLFK